MVDIAGIGTSIANFGIGLLAGLGDVIVFLLPTFSLGNVLDGLDPQLLRAVNYYVPVTLMLNTAQAWIIAIIMWYLYQIILRWAKAIR